ncbi:MAG: SRPBCC domain-containing protein [Acidobacteriota bacterium]
MKTMNNPSLAVLGVLAASTLIGGGDKSTKAETGGPTVKVLKGNHMTDTTANVEKRDLAITRLFDAPIERVWKAWTDPDYVVRWWAQQALPRLPAK